MRLFNLFHSMRCIAKDSGMLPLLGLTILASQYLRQHRAAVKQFSRWEAHLWALVNRVRSAETGGVKVSASAFISAARRTRCSRLSRACECINR